MGTGPSPAVLPKLDPELADPLLPVEDGSCRRKGTRPPVIPFVLCMECPLLWFAATNPDPKLDSDGVVSRSPDIRPSSNMSDKDGRGCRPFKSPLLPSFQVGAEFREYGALGLLSICADSGDAVFSSRELRVES